MRIFNGINFGYSSCSEHNLFILIFQLERNWKEIGGINLFLGKIFFKVSKIRKAFQRNRVYLS